MASGYLRERKNKNGSRSWQIVIEDERDPVTGKRTRHYKTVNGTKKQAEALKLKMMAEIDSGGIVTASAMKTGDWMREWLKLYLPNIEATTRDSYRDKIENYIEPILGNIPLKALKTSNVQSWVNELAQRKLAPKTIRNAYNNLNAAMKKAVLLQMIPHNPCNGAELPKMKRYQAQVYTSAELNALLTAAKDTDFHLAIAIMSATGIRRGELLALKWENVDIANRVIHIKENMVQAGTEILEKSPKSDSGLRDISIGGKLATLLSEAKMQYFVDMAEPGFRDLGYVIHKHNGTPYRPDSMTQKWNRFLKMHNLRYIRLHDLRHTHATLLLQSGVNVKTVQDRLGHSDVTITLNTYAHVTSDMAQEAANKIDGIINF